MGKEGEQIAMFVDHLVGRLAASMPCPRLDPDGVRLVADIGCLKGRSVFEAVTGTTRSSLSAVVTRTGG